MSNLEYIRNALTSYNSVEGATQFFCKLGYPTIVPLPLDLEKFPESIRRILAQVVQVVHIQDTSSFRIFHVELATPTVRRTDIRRFLEYYYSQFPQGENLFIFSSKESYDELVFVSPKRLPDRRNPFKGRLWLRILWIRREELYRTDLEVLNGIRVNDVLTSEQIWKRHEEAFSVQRVTEQFFKDYTEAFCRFREHIEKTHPNNGRAWACDYTHHLLNRIMFLYFIVRKGWLLGPDGKPDRKFMRNFWYAYKEARDAGRVSENSFHSEWLSVLFFEAFNNKWQNRHEYLQRFPKWLIKAFSEAPYLNGGLYHKTKLDECQQTPIPDTLFELLFERWVDGTFPGLFERYNFTVVETGRFDEEVAVDPEMLGMVYERLVNIIFEIGDRDEDLRSAAGIFYTPRTEIDLMCRLSLVDWLSNQLGENYKDLLYCWVFSFSEEEKREADEAITREGLWEQLNDLVKRVRICDPACGSGSFLVGMLLILDDLQARCNSKLGIDETPYDRRKRILRDQLYGVDVMEWAVRVAELRLWLQLVVETDLHPREQPFEPLLPNLTLNLRPGDSLLQTIGDLDFSPLRRSELSIPKFLKGRLTQLKNQKRRFFDGKDNALSDKLIKKEEKNLFLDILEAKIHELTNQIVNRRRELELLTSQQTMKWKRTENSKIKNRIEAELYRLDEQKRLFQNAYKALQSESEPPFIWDLAFVEIFEDERPGFDIVIGNPPYVRQEDIRDYLKRFNRDEYLERLNESLRAIYPAFMGKSRKVSGRADYYVYFYLHALSLLADKGTFCFITSNSWLDVDFGKDLQEFFLCYGDLKMVIDNRVKRSIPQADVNTIIVLAGQPKRNSALTDDEMKGHPVRFIAFRVPFEDTMSPIIFSEIEKDELYQPMLHFKVLKRPEYRAIWLDAYTLWLEGLKKEGNNEQMVEIREYKGNKWGGRYLRAPEVFFTILEKGKDKLVRLGEIAEVRRGFTTGANEFFYLEPVGRTVKEVNELRRKKPMAVVRVKNDAGWEGEIEVSWLRPVIKSPKEIKTLKVQLEDLRYLVFMPPDDVRKAIDLGKEPPLSKYPKAFSYIRWGERQGYPDRPTCKSRQWWWDLHGTVSCALVLRATNDRPAVYISKIPIAHDQTFYGISECEDIHISIFNSTLVCWLVREILSGASSSLGLGATWAAVYEITNLLVLNPILIVSDQKEILLSAFDRLSRRPVRSIFEELGFALCRKRGCEQSDHPYEDVKPESLTLEQVQRASPDRFELDSVVFDVLNLTNEERLEVYRAVIQLVKERLVKAKSVKYKR